MPNPASIQARAFGDRWLALDLPRHLVHVPAATLRVRLGELGLRIERTSQLRGGQVVFGWLHGIVGALPGHPDLYDAIRRPEARREPLAPARRLAILAAGALALPLAALGAALEAALAAAEPSTLRPAVSEPSRPKTVVVMPALNAAKTLETTVAAIPRDWVDEIILVDDRSTDETVRLARELGVHVVWHPHNVGYGGNQKTCYLEALQRGAEIVVMLHPDGQYEPSLIPKLIEPIRDGEADLVLGTRMAEPGAAREAGMPLYKRVANRA